MKILIDIRSTLKQKTGIGYYTLNIVQELARIDAENDYYLYSKIRFFDRKRKLPDIESKRFRHYINRFKSHPLKFFNKMDIIHTSAFDFTNKPKAQLVVVVHDVIHRAYPKGHSKETIDYIEKGLLKTLSIADKIITPSETTSKDLVKFYQVSPEKINVIYPGAPKPDKSISLECVQEIIRKYKIPEKFILYVGTLEPRKNVEGLILAYKKIKDKIPHKLVIAGMKGWLCEGIFDLVSKEGLDDDVIFTGYVSGDDLACLYKKACLFVYPSFYEGAGLPVLEAFSYGVAVITSNVSSTAEIASDGAMLVDPYDTDDMADAIYKVVSDEALRQNLISRGHKRADLFTWEKTARGTLSVFCVLKN